MEEKENMYSLTNEIIAKVVELIDKNEKNKAKELLNQYKLFMQAMNAIDNFLKN